MIIRKAFYWWLFPAAVVLPVWLLSAGPSSARAAAGRFLGLLVLCPILFVAMLTVGGIVWRAGVSGEARRVLVGRRPPHRVAPRIVGFGFFVPGSTGWFAVARILLCIGDFWVSLWELLTETRSRVRQTFAAYERAAHPSRPGIRPPTRSTPASTSSSRSAATGTDRRCRTGRFGKRAPSMAELTVCAAARLCHRGASISRGHPIPNSRPSPPQQETAPSPSSTCGGYRERTAMHILDQLDAASLKQDIPDFRAGDTVKVHVNIIEGTRSRVQVFQGVVIGRSGEGVRETFTVRKVSFQVGVERTFPVHSPVIDKIEVVTRGDVRRAKLYYLRELRGKKAKIKEKRDN